MAEIISSEFKAYDEKLNLKLDQLYISKDGKYYKLSDLVIFVDNASKDYRSIRSYDDFKKNLSDGGTKGVYLKNSDGSRSSTQVKRSDVVSVADGKTIYSGVYTRALTVPTQYESTNILAVGESIYHGLKRVHNVKGVDFVLNSSRYVLVKLDRDANYTFLKADQLGYYEGGSFVSLVGKTVDEIKGKNLFTTSGKRIGSIYTEKAFTFGRAIAQEQINPDTFTRSMYEFDADGKVVMETVDGVTRPKMTDQPIDRVYSDHTFRKVDGQARLEVRNYQKSAKGEGKSIQVVFKGSNAPTMVDIDLLYEMDEVGKVSSKLKADAFKTKADVNKLIGKPLLVQVSEGNYREIEPLTLEQAVFTYTIQMQRIETTSPEHIMADNAMLMLEDGRYIKEKSVVRPIAYDFADGDDAFDALYVKYTDGEGKEQGVIVPKDTFSASPTRNINGVIMHVKNAFRIKKSKKPLNECAVIQTSNKPGQKYHECRTLKSPRYEAGVIKTTDLEVTEDEINGIVATTIEAYKNGEYVLEEVIDDHGNLVKLDDRHKRYIETDYRYETDYANNADHYNFLKMNPLKFDAKKDELIGGPHFDEGQANKEGFKVWGDWVARVVKAWTSLPGILIGFAIPPLFIASVVSAVGVSIGIPIVNSIRAYRHNHRQYKYRDKTEYNRKQTTKQVERELQAMYDQVKEDIAVIDANASLTDEQKKAQKEIVKRKFLDKFSQVEQTMDSLHTSKYYSEFKVVDGVAEVNEGNAPLMSAYREMMSDLKKKIAKLKTNVAKLQKRAKKDPSKRDELNSLQDQLTNLESEYEGKLQYYTSQGQVTPMDESATSLENKANSMRGLVLAKFFGERLADEEEMTLEEERRALDCMEYADGIEFDPRLKKDERKGLDRVVIEEREDKIEKAVIKLKNSKLARKSRETEHKAVVVESSVPAVVPALPAPPPPEHEMPAPDTLDERKKVRPTNTWSLDKYNKFIEFLINVRKKLNDGKKITKRDFERLVKGKEFMNLTRNKFKTLGFTGLDYKKFQTSQKMYDKIMADLGVVADDVLTR